MFDDQDQATFSSSSDQEDTLSLLIGDVGSLLDIETASKAHVKSRNNSPSKHVYRDLQNTTERCALKDLVLSPEIKGIKKVDKGHFSDEEDVKTHPNMFDLNKEPVILFQPEMKNWGDFKITKKSEEFYEEVDSENDNKSDTVFPNQPPSTPDSYEHENNKNPIIFHNLYGNSSKDEAHELSLIHI